MNQELFSIKLNSHLVINGIKGTQIPGQILSLFKDFQILSIENLKEKIIEIESMCKQSKLKNTKVFKNIWKIINSNDRDQIINMIYNIILSSEGIGLLPGFGYAEIENSKIKHKFFQNPEKISIFKVGL